MQEWVIEEMETLNLGDRRRKERAMQIVEDWSERPEASIPQACGSAARTKASYRFLQSQFIPPQELRQAQADATIKRLTGLKRILVAQDTTSLDFTTHTATRGLGLLDHPACSGLLVHSGLALTEQGVPLGVLHQQVWVRDKEMIGRAAQRRQQPTEGKESQRWLDMVQRCQKLVPTEVQAVIIGDREADIFDLFALQRAPHLHLLVRAAHQRRVRFVEPRPAMEPPAMEPPAMEPPAMEPPAMEPPAMEPPAMEPPAMEPPAMEPPAMEPPAMDGYLWESVRESPLRGRMTVEVQRSNQGAAHRAARQAQVEIRFLQVELLPPRNGVGPDGRWRTVTPAAGVEVTAVLVEEKNAPPGATPLCWLLLTTVEVTTSEAAQQCIHWYNQRWKVERYHYTLKSGCGVEKLQLETRERLERALALYSIVAWRLLWLTYQARETPTAPCTLILEEDEWKVLVIAMQKPARLPVQPPDLRQAMRWIAQLGGFLGRKGDGEPGVKALWRGLQRLQDLTEGYRCAVALLGNG